MTVDKRTWRIGEVATAAGLTVRALHHYDQIGLVVPSARTSGGHRLYTDADLAVLYQVTALRQLGLSLDQIAVLRAGHADVRQVIDQQLALVDRQIRTATRLREQLLAARDAGPGADGAGFAEIIKLAGDLTGYRSARYGSTGAGSNRPVTAGPTGATWSPTLTRPVPSADARRR
jgi:DNA-binding transcriptional MerR regulator